MNVEVTRFPDIFMQLAKFREDVMVTEVNLETGQAKVYYDSENIDIEDLKGVIVKSCYKV